MASHASDLPPSGTTSSINAGRIGWLLSGLAIAFFLLDAAMKIAGLPQVGETAATLGWPTDIGFWRAMGLVLLACTAIYAWPRTAVLGAILLTAYLGGAIATHVRIANPLFSHTFFGIYLAGIVWGGLWLLLPQLRALVPVISGPVASSGERP
ncbi:DoxX family protein [Qipengyuania sp. SS22]|uniref:DoxX family protein n=1 Tax=Qipengyuania sp. SS22 TaxID=2979461 RepID=UPI0021E5FD8D|nr:DoxX family protein [Qipengyuania sp. SS22]UYH55378.1 DoxX family protein [Qipengyuania sp. SS22]